MTAVTDAHQAARKVSQRGDILLLLRTRPPERVRAIEPRLLGIDDAAIALAVSPREVKILVQRGELGSVKLGARRLIPVEALDEYVAVLRAEAER